MGDTVAAQPRGLELFGARSRRRALTVTGKKGAALEKLGIGSLQDLLQHYPRYHVDRSNLRTIRDLKQLAVEQDLGEVQVHGTVKKLNRPFKTKSGKLMITGTIGDETGSISVTWFNQQWVLRALSPGTEAFFYGRMREYRGKMQMSSPRFELLRTGREPFNVGRIIPIYPATADLSSDQLRRLMWDAFQSEYLDPQPRFRLSSHELRSDSATGLTTITAQPSSPCSYSAIGSTPTCCLGHSLPTSGGKQCEASSQSQP